MPRAIVIDDNTSVHNGHYNELSSLLLSAATEEGFRPALIAHQDFRGNSSVPSDCHVARVFTTRRMTRWSCGFDGQSRVARDVDGTPLHKTFRNQYSATKDEWLTRSQWRPTEMLNRWSAGLLRAIEAMQPKEDDELIFQTADDFMMVALARALAPYRATRLRIKAIFHYAVYGANDPPSDTCIAFDQQINHALNLLAFHDVKLLATTEPLAAQMNAGSLTKHVEAIPYPIRIPSQIKNHFNEVPRLVLGGVHRVEQGRDAVAPFLEAVQRQFVEKNRFSLTLRLDAKHWKRLVPSSLHEVFEPAMKRQAALIETGDSQASSLPTIDVRPATLTEPQYYQMLTAGDLGVLLYDAKRYQVRCSGILLEFLTRGIPVVAPDQCWLGDIVRKYSGANPIGYLYRDSHEIPDLLARFLENREAIQQAALQVAPIISRAHAPRTTLAQILRHQASLKVAA
jgi:hypothetical protein